MKKYYRYSASSGTVQHRGVLYKAAPNYRYSDVLFFKDVTKHSPSVVLEYNPSLDGSTWIQLWPTPIAQANVTGLASAGVFKNEAKLSWTDPVNVDYTGVQITWTPATGPTQPILVAKGVQKANIKGLVNGTAYTFTVKAVDMAALLSTGATVGVTPNSEAVNPADCSGASSVQDPGGQEIVVSWVDSVAVDLDYVEVSWSPSTIASPQKVQPGQQRLIVSQLQSGTSYTFTIKAVDTSGNKSTGITTTKTPL